MTEKKIANKIILLSGGGTGGSVTPLLAMAAELIKEDEQGKLNLLFVGTRSGPEQEMVAAFNREIGPLRFLTITSGKWRRYISFRNFLDVFKIIVGFFQAFFLLSRQRPAVVISAGAFVSVPLVWAAALKKIPVLIHQQDVRPGLANKLMAPFARVITVTFEKSIDDYGARAIWVGNPTQELSPADKQTLIKEIRNKYNLNFDQPVILITGGGTGAVAINKLVFKSVKELGARYQIIHLTGRGKSAFPALEYNNYHFQEFVTPQEFLGLAVTADLIVSRCGMAALTEIAVLNKAAILIPMPNSHQVDNAAIFLKNQAALVLDQTELSSQKLIDEINRVFDDILLKEKLSANTIKVIRRGATATLIGIIWEMIK